METCHTGRIFHHGLNAVPFEDDDPQHITNGITDGVQNILPAREKPIENLMRSAEKLLTVCV